MKIRIKKSEENSTTCRKDQFCCQIGICSKKHTLGRNTHFKARRQVEQYSGSRHQKPTDRYGWVSYCRRASLRERRWDSEESKPTAGGDFREEGCEENVNIDSFPGTHTQAITTNVTLAFEV